MRLLVTGGTGYLGSRAAEALAAGGHHVCVLSRKGSSRRDCLAASPLISIRDWTDLEVRMIFEEGVDAVVHAAAAYGRSGETEAFVREANVESPSRLLAAATAAGIRGWVNVGTSLPADLNVYSRTKQAFAEHLREAATQGGPCVVQLTYEHFFGPGDDNSKFTTRVIRACLANQPELLLTSGDQRRDFIFIDDAVAALVHAVQLVPALDVTVIEAGVGSGVAIQVRDFVERVHELAGSVTALRFGALPLRPGEPQECVADPEPLAALGWRALVSLDEGLRRTIAQERKLMTEIKDC